VNIAASEPAMSAFVIPAVSGVAAGPDVGFALVNAGAGSATITGTVRDASGTVLAARDYQMAPGAQSAAFVQEFFSGQGCSPCLRPQMLSPGYSSVTFRSPSPQFAATALITEGAALASSPVEPIED
jgi:hypothetical protein